MRTIAAIEIYRYSAAVLANKLPETHPARLSVQNNLALALRSAGRYGEALETITQAVRMRKGVLGPENHLTLLSRSNQGAVLAALERYPEAIAIHRDVYAIRTRLFGETNPETVKSLHNLASTLGDAGNVGSAAVLRESGRRSHPASSALATSLR